MPAGSGDPFHHVRDAPYFELPQFLGGQWHLPSLFGFQITRFMVLQVVAGLLILWIFRGLTRRVKTEGYPRGAWWNFWEFIALYIRDEVVRPTIGSGHHGHDDDHHAGEADSHGEAGHAHSEHGHTGHGHTGAAVGALPVSAAAVAHPADKYLPFIWTCFFYVLFCNLLGAIPWLGSATGEINVTGAMAFAVLAVVLATGMAAQGAGNFWMSLAPSMELPGPMKILLVPMIWVIELFGLIVKHAVLAIRLFANVMAGHTVIAVILGFIAVEGVASTGLFYIVTPASILGQVAIGLLELLVAFIQAYIFAFLATLFISTALHPH